MIGVLAIIGIFAGIIVPRVIKATARSKINSTAVSYNSLKTTVSDYFGQNGSFPVRAGTGATNGPVADRCQQRQCLHHGDRWRRQL